MKKSRKQIIAQIAQMDKVLQYHKKNLAEHKDYFVQSRMTGWYVAAPALFIVAFFIGWKAERKNWSGKIMQYIVEVGTVILVSYFKKTIIALFK